MIYNIVQCQCRCLAIYKSVLSLKKQITSKKHFLSHLHFVQPGQHIFLWQYAIIQYAIMTIWSPVIGDRANPGIIEWVVTVYSQYRPRKDDHFFAVLNYVLSPLPARVAALLSFTTAGLHPGSIWLHMQAQIRVCECEKWFGRTGDWLCSDTRVGKIHAFAINSDCNNAVIIRQVASNF